MSKSAGCTAGTVEHTTPLQEGRRVSDHYRTISGTRPPAIEVTVPPRATAPGLVMLTPTAGKGYDGGLMLLDSSGELVWFSRTSNLTTNLQVQQYKGEPVLTWWEGQDILPGYGSGSYVLADTSYREIRRVHAAGSHSGDLHDFVLTPNGTALFTIYQVRPADLSSVGGSRYGTLLDSLFQEIDLDSGKLLMQWRASDHISLKESYARAPKDGRKKYDFFHINSINVAPDGNLLISARHTWTVYKVDRSTGAIIWRMNGKQSDFNMGPGTPFAWQHHAIQHGGSRLTLFDDGAGLYNTEKRSRGVTLALDEPGRRVRLVRQYLPDPSMLATSQGSMQLLSNDHAFIGWGSQPYFSEYDDNGRLIFDARLPNVCHSYRAFRFTWKGRPKDAPRVVATRSSSTKVEVYASWNGATDVASWDVLVGDHTSNMREIGRFRRAGFETVMTVSTLKSKVSVRARDVDKRILAESRPVQIAE